MNGHVPSQHPADVARRLRTENPEAAAAELLSFPDEQAAGVLAEFDGDFAAEVAACLPADRRRALLSDMPADEAADIAGEFSDTEREELLDQLPAEESERIEQILQYPEDSAGGIMSDRFISLPAHLTIGEARERLAATEGGEGVQGPLYVYVSDANLRLLGVVSIRDLLFRKADRPLREVMNPDVKRLRVDDDQEKVADLFSRYHYLALPVVDARDRLVGVVEADRVIEVVEDEATEDMQKMVGLSGEEHVYTPWREALKPRMMWLHINLLTTFLAGATVAVFEDTIARWTALAIFLPVVAGQGGNAGMQTLTVIIRGLALGEIPVQEARRALRKEIILGLVNGLIIGLVTGGIGYLWKGHAGLGLVVGGAMVLNMLAAALSGILIPFGLKKLRIDPALASSILLTTVTDVGGFFFFLGLAALVLRVAG